MQQRNVEHVGTGRQRVVFRHGRVVLKVPLDDWGFASNYRESQIYRKNKLHPNGCNYARCRLHASGILVMVLLGPVPNEERPDWADWIDCAQIGKTRNGEVVAFDYGF